jgi:sugar phosphate isomerase/epimerase
MKKYSIGSWAFVFNQEQPTNDFHTLVHKLGHLGYAGVELLGYAPHPTPDSHDTKEKRQKLRKMVVDHRLEFSGYAPLMWTEKLWSVEDHRPFVALFEKNAIFAEDLGIKTTRVDTVEPVASAADFDPKLLFDRCVNAFDACAKIAADHGLTIAWEFEPGFALNKPDEVVALVDAVRAQGNANFGVLLDTWNAHVCTAGNSLELLHRLKGKITHLHLSDSDGTVNEYNGPVHVTLGQGVLNFDQLMPELLTCGVPNDWWCVDLCFWPDAWTSAAESKRFLDKLRHKYAA